MPNYSELYGLPSASALSLPHYNTGYLNYSKPISRYPGVYKPHLTTISEITSPFRRLNAPKLSYPTDISSRNLKPIKVINTSDIDVSVNKYKKYEKKAQRLKAVDTKPTYVQVQEQPQEIQESKPKTTIRRDRATVRIRTVHADTIKQEIGAFKTWRDNFEPNELTNEVKVRKKTKGEILKEKFLIRSRSKENIPQTIDLLKKTSSFRDICTAITSENISDDLNPGQPEEVQRRQSKQLSNENLLKEIRRVSTELSQEDLNLLNTILSNQEDNISSESSDESVTSVNLSDFSNTNKIEEEEEIKEEIVPVVADINKSCVEKEKPIKKQNLIKSKSETKVQKINNNIIQSKSDANVIKKKTATYSDTLDTLSKFGNNNTPKGINELDLDEKCIQDSKKVSNTVNIKDKTELANRTNKILNVKPVSTFKNKKQIVEKDVTQQIPTPTTEEIIKKPVNDNKNIETTTKKKCAKHLSPLQIEKKIFKSIPKQLLVTTVVPGRKQVAKVSTIPVPVKDISNVEIQEIKFKTKPVITGSVDDIVVPKNTLVARINHLEVDVEVEKPIKMDKKFTLNVTVNVERPKKDKINFDKVTITNGTIVHPLTEKSLENVIIPKNNTKQDGKKIKQLTAIKKVKKKDNTSNETCLDSVPEDSVLKESQTEQITNNDILETKDDTKNQEQVQDNNSTTPTKIISKRSLLKKPTKEDPDLIVFVPPPEPEPEPTPPVEENKDVFVPLQSNRLTQWMHPWVKPEQFDECPVEIFARPKIIRGRHYPRPRKRNGNAPPQVATQSADNESDGSDSDDNTSTEDTSASLRSNDSGFGSTIPEKNNASQIESVNDQLDSSENQTQENIFVLPEDGKVIPPATTLPRFRKYSVDDFEFLKVLGKGSFGKVLLSKLKDTDYYYAVKCLKKDVIVEDDDVECTLIERKVLALGTRHPFLCHLLCTFQTESHLFFVMEYLNGGDLMFHITTGGCFPEDQARFYSAEIISGLQFLHSKGIIYRDLKLDNILLDFDGHARLADFGMCQLQIFLDRMAESFCGTPDYMAPEIIKGQHYNQAVDWWSFGVLLYEMLLGQSPFSGCDEDELFWSICNEKPVFPKHLSTYAIDVLTLLLDKDQSKRLGNRFCPHGPIRDHNFYRNLDWKALEARQIEAPFKPNLVHPLDTQYFDINFTKEAVKLSATEVQILGTIDQSQFQGFSYTNPNATDR